MLAANHRAPRSAGGDVLLHNTLGYKLAALPVRDARSKHGLSFCPLDTSLLAGGSDDGSVYVWDVKRRDLAQLYSRKHAVRPPPPAPVVSHAHCAAALPLPAGRSLPHTTDPHHPLPLLLPPLPLSPPVQNPAGPRLRRLLQPDAHAAAVQRRHRRPPLPVGPPHAVGGAARAARLRPVGTGGPR